METIYSKVIWGELGLKDYKIHQEKPEKTENLILDWIKNTDLEKVEEVLSELSWFRKISYESYYDGPFYGMSQSDDEVLEKMEGGIKADIVIHDIGIMTSILDIAIKTRMNPSSLVFIAKILEEFWKKVPENYTNPNDDNGHNWGYKT